MELYIWVKDKDINATLSETNPYRASREKLLDRGRDSKVSGSIPMQL